MNESEKLFEQIKGEIFIAVLKTMGNQMGLASDGITDFVRVLVKNGCPVDAIIKSIVELADKNGEEDGDEDDADE